MSHREKFAAIVAALAVAFGAGVLVERPSGGQSHKQVAVIYVAPQSARTPDGARPEAPPRGVPRFVGPVKHSSSNGLHLIEGFEGFESCPYWDAYGGVWTRGYGETEGIHSYSGCISRSYGEANLGSRLERFYEWALRDLGVSLNQNQWDALDSFAWNLGAGIFTGTLRYDLQSRQFYAAGQVMLQYVHAGGQVLQGLVTRRQAEVRLLLTPVSTPTPVAKQSRATLLRIRAELRRDLTRHRCRVGPYHGRGRYHAICSTWLREGRQVNRELRGAR